MTAQELKNSILQLAIQGKLVKQNPNDEPASVLLEKIKEEREKLIKEKKIKREKYSKIYKDPSDNHYYEKFEDGTINDITEEIPFEIPDSWCWTKFKNICNIVSARRVHQADWKTSGIPFYRAREIGKLADDGFVNNELFISNELFEKFSKNGVPQPNDIMITAVGTLGKCYIVKEEDKFYYKDASVICLENRFELNADYLVNYINSNTMKEQIKNNSSGTTVETLTMVRMNEYYIPIPPINEQMKIVEKIQKLFPYIAKFNEKYEKLELLNSSYKEELKKSILQCAIQGKLIPQNPNDESADILINKILEEKRELIKIKQIKKENLSVIYEDDTDNQFYEKFDDGTIVNITDEIPFEIPDNWCWTRLGNILIKLTDGTHKTPKYVEKGIPFISVKDMSSGILKFDNTKYITPEEHKMLYERCNPQKGDIILSKVGTTGIPVIVETDIEFSLFVSLALLKFNNKYINKEFLKNLILSPLVQNQCRENTKGVGNKNWVMKDIAKTLIAIPPYIEQLKIIEKLNNILSFLKTAE